jgi:hypothetical protein
MNTNNMTANISSFSDSWGDLWKSDQPLDFEVFLNSDFLAANAIRSRHMPSSVVQQDRYQPSRQRA